MLARCYNPDKDGFRFYGGRGITVCEEWKNSFQAFYKWATDNHWNSGLDVDRRDNDGNYSPSNCRLITHKENCRNTRKNAMLTFNNETHCISEWAEIIGIKPGTLSYRINKGGWTIEKALSTPARKMRSRTCI
jgi:hypothetical protein